MLSVGFDPAFLDTIVRAEDKDGSLISELPPPGFHHRQTKVERVAGGNAVNIAYVLVKLGNEINLIIPSDDLFDTLLKQRNLKCTYRIHETVNETVALIWKPGEIQFNQVIGEIGSEHYTKEVHKYWTESTIQTSVNWGLNYLSDEWISCLWLASCGWTYEEIDEVRSKVYSQAIEEDNLQSNLVLEPGSIKSHPHREKLSKLLSTIASSLYSSLYPIFSCNEEENEEYSDLDFTTKIIHTKDHVIKFNGGSKQIVEVPKIERIKTFVGAGDSFLAGIIHQLFHSNRLDVNFAINTAQRYMTGTL